MHAEERHPVDTARERGIAVFKEMFGEDYGRRSAARWNEFNAPLRDHILESAFGAVWARPELDRRTRSAITLAMLATLRALDELEIHTSVALRNGLTAVEIREVILQAAVYAGVPASLAAMKVAERVLREQNALDTGA
jgi:alkylhydroperoxidase/carboxymuconolactone decarboxylase family protein YurZ